MKIKAVLGPSAELAGGVRTGYVSPHCLVLRMGAYWHVNSGTLLAVVSPSVILGIKFQREKKMMRLK